MRTVATIAAGLAEVAGNFAARPDPSAGVSSWTKPAGFAAFVVLLVMWGWAPPKLPSVQVIGNGSRPALAESPAAAHPATRLVVSLGAAMGLAPLVAAAPGLLLPGANFPRQAVSPALLTTAIVAVVLFVAITVLTAMGESEVHEAGLDASRSWVIAGIAGIATAAVAAIASLPVVAARRRRSVSTGITGLDAALRAITVHRAVRTFAASPRE